MEFFGCWWGEGWLEARFGEGGRGVGLVHRMSVGEGYAVSKSDS